MSNKKEFTGFKNSKAHTNEHIEWSRRSFLQTIGLASAGSMMLGGSYISTAISEPLMMKLNEVDNEGC